MYNLLPEFLGRYFLSVFRVIAVNGELLHIRLIVDSSLHELIVDLHGHIGTRHLAFLHLGIDKGFRVGMLDTDGEHQRTTTTILCYFTCTITITLHKWDQTC